MNGPDLPKRHPSEIPRIAPEDFEIFARQEKDFGRYFEIFKRAQPDLAHWLATSGTLDSDPSYLRAKRAFVLGVMGCYALIDTALAIDKIQASIDSGIESLLSDDGDGDEDLRPSA